MSETRTLQYTDRERGYSYQFDIEMGKDFGTLFISEGTNTDPVCVVPGVYRISGYDFVRNIGPGRRNILGVGRHYLDVYLSKR